MSIHAELLGLLANLAASNAQHGNTDAARTAAWALSCVAWHATKIPALNNEQALWVMLTGQALLTVMDLLASYAKQDNALAKHCLHYIEVVAGACLPGGPTAAVAAGGDGSATQFLKDALQLASSVLRQTTDQRLQVGKSNIH